MKKILLLLIAFITTLSFSQVGINTVTPDSSSIFEVNSTDKGILIPRMSTSDRNLISSPAKGLLIYNSSLDVFQYNSNTAATPNWQSLSAGSSSSSNESIKYSNTDTSTNLNQTTAINAPLLGNLEWNDNTSIYTPNTTAHSITINEAGRYKFVVNVPVVTGSNTDNIAPEMRIAVDGTEVGSYASTGFIRTSNAHQESSLHLTEILEISANQVITVNIIRTGNSSTVTFRAANSASIYIEKLN